ncbi:unnamed protein product, partial [Polarella glacialis]
SSSRATGGYPGVTNFYSFEAQWKRLRGKPLERAALLQKIGANSLPALLRESLDGELVASITEAILIDMSGDREGGGPASATFAAEAMQALARTPRFDLSLHCLSKEERKIIEQVLEILDGQSTACSKESLDALRFAYRPPEPRPKSPEPQELAEQFDEDDIPEDQPRSSEVGADFSLDGCD